MKSKSDNLIILDPLPLIQRKQSNTLIKMGEALAQWNTPRENSRMTRRNFILQESQQQERQEQLVDSLHQQQQERDCIQAILDGDVLVFLPIGTNKIIFQTPAVTRFAHSIPNVALTIVLFTYTALGRVLHFIANLSGEKSIIKSNYTAHEIDQIMQSDTANVKDDINLSNRHELKKWFTELGLSDKAAISAVQFVTSPDIGVSSTGDLLYLDDSDIAELTGTIIKTKVGVGKFKAALSALRTSAAQSSLTPQQRDRSDD